MFGLIACVDNYTIQEHYKQLLAEKVWLPYEVLAVQFKKYLKTDWKFELAKKEREEQKPSWQPDREMIFASLFRDDLFQKYISDPSLYANLFDFAKSIAENLEWDLLNKVFFKKDSFDNQEKLQLDELQLRWEKELTALSGDDKRMHLIKKFALEHLQSKLKLVLKQPWVSTETKQKLLADMKKI